MNVVILSGRLTKNPELRSTTTTDVCQFSLAVDSGKIDETGKRIVNFIDCVCFGKQAENLHRFKMKGDIIELKGRIQVDKYQNKDGKNTYKTFVYVETINYITSSQTQAYKSKNEQKDAYQEMSKKVEEENELPF